MPSWELAIERPAQVLGKCAYSTCMHNVMHLGVADFLACRFLGVGWLDQLDHNGWLNPHTLSPKLIALTPRLWMFTNIKPEIMLTLSTMPML